MGDVGEYWRDVKEHRKEQREKYRGNIPVALERLNASGLPYEQFSHDHYRVNGEIDYWPSTGYWKHMKGKHKGRGIDSLLRFAKHKQEG